jgi:hypothetical protein
MNVVPLAGPDGRFETPLFFLSMPLYHGPAPRANARAKPGRWSGRRTVVRKQHRYLLALTLECGLRGEDLFGEMPRRVALGRGERGRRRAGGRGALGQPLAALPAEFGAWRVGLAAVRARGCEANPAFVTEGSIGAANP